MNKAAEEVTYYAKKGQAIKVRKLRNHSKRIRENWKA